MTIHSLRHTFCTRLAKAGVRLLDAQNLMGPSDPKLTAEIYSHITPQDLRPSIDKLPPLLGNDGESMIKEGTNLIGWGSRRLSPARMMAESRIVCVA